MYNYVVSNTNIDIFTKTFKKVDILPQTSKALKTVDKFPWTQTSIMSTQVMLNVVCR